MIHKRYQESYEYVENVISKSKKEYLIQFNNKAINALKKRKSWSSDRQIWNIKQSFVRDKKVSLDTIIIQKIIIHNLKSRDNYRYHGDSLTLVNWKYVLPKDILKQINYFGIDSNETKELFELLKEEILLINKSKIILNDYKDFDEIISEEERLELQVNIMLVKQLIEVRDSLVTMKKYSELSKVLPKIKNVP